MTPPDRTPRPDHAPDVAAIIRRAASTATADRLGRGTA